MMNGKRSIGVTLYSFFLILIGIFVLRLLIRIDFPLRAFKSIFNCTFLLVGVLLIISGLGIFLLKNWARVISLSLSIFFILCSITYFGFFPWDNLTSPRSIAWITTVLCSLLIPILNKRRIIKYIISFAAIFGLLSLTVMMVLPRQPLSWSEYNRLGCSISDRLMPMIPWGIMVLCSLLTLIFSQKKILRRAALCFATANSLLLLLLFGNLWFFDSALVIPFLVFPVVIGLFTLVFFTHPKVKKQFISIIKADSVSLPKQLHKATDFYIISKNFIAALLSNSY